MATIETENNYQFDGRFTHSILIVGQTGCGKTTLVQNLARNKMFGKIKTVDWVAKIKLSEKREEDMKQCFETWIFNTNGSNMDKKPLLHA